MTTEFKVGDKVRVIEESSCGWLGIGTETVVERILPYHHLSPEEAGGKVMYVLAGDAEECYYEEDLELISTEPEVTPEPAPTPPTFKPGAKVRYNHSFSCTPTYPDLVGRAGYIVSASDETKMAEVSFGGRPERIAWANLELIEEAVEEEAEVEGEVELKVGDKILCTPGLDYIGTILGFSPYNNVQVAWPEETRLNTRGFVEQCRRDYLEFVGEEPSAESLVKEVEPEVILETGNLVLDSWGQLGLIDQIGGDYDIIIDWERDGKMYQSRASTEYWRKKYLDSIAVEPQVRSEQTDGAIPPEFFEDLEPVPQRYFKSNYIDTATEIAKLVEEKQEAYGDSFGKSGQVLQILYPEGIAPEQYDDALAVVRIIDKLFRIANKKRAFGESPYRDITGYALLGVVRDEIC